MTARHGDEAGVAAQALAGQHAQRQLSRRYALDDAARAIGDQHLGHAAVPDLDLSLLEVNVGQDRGQEHVAGQQHPQLAVHLA